MNDSAWARWAADRPTTDLLHLDSAAVGRSSVATLEAVAAHARLEAEVGGYVAEELVRPALTRLRRDVAALLGSDEEGVAFTESATTALEILAHAWPLPAGARVGVAASEWGPNLELLEAHGVAVEPLPVDDLGVLDLDGLERRLDTDPPDLLLVDLVAAHRGLVQPAGRVVEIGRRHDVAVWLDAAQAVGHVVVPPGADAVVATSRKWLTGPRGVGMLAVAERHRPHLRVRRPAKHPDRPTVHLLESEEAHVAGRVGLGVAVREHLAIGSEVVAARLGEVGRAVREMAAGLPGWEPVLPDAPAGSTTSLRPTAGQDVARTRARLLHEHRILTSVCLPWRAPGEMTGEMAGKMTGGRGGEMADAMAGPWLRLSPHVDLTADDLERVAKALTEG